MRDLPKWWRAIRFGEALTAKYGKSLDKALRVDGAPFPVVGSAGTMATTPYALSTEPCIVIGRKGNIGEARLFPDGCWPIDTTYFVEIPTDFNGRFLELGLEVADLQALDSSTTTPSLRRQDLENIVLTCPPLAEQDEIVRILDTQLARIDIVLRSVQAVRDKADQFRRSLLHAAFTGQLTQPDPSRGDALPKGWQSETLGDLTSSTRPICYGVLKPGDHFPGGVPLVRIVDIAGDRLDLRGCHLISPTLDSEFSRSRLKGGEVLLSIQGTVGRVAIAPSSADGANISRTIAVIKPDSRTSSEFVRLWLLDCSSRGAFKVGGTTRASLNIGDLRSMRCPLPSHAEQAEIVRILDTQLARIDAAVAAADRVEVECGRLRRSLLQAAFTGELTRKWRESRG